MTKTGDTVSVSGGDIRLLEIIKYANSVEPHVLTTPNGIEFLKKYDQKYKQAYVINETVKGGLLSNIIISLKSFFYGKSGVKKYDGDIVYSSSEHIYDVLPAFRLKVSKKCKWVAVYHWVEDYPWREKRGNTPVVPRYAYWLNRYIAGFIIKHFADQILAVSDQTKDKLVAQKRIKPSRIKAVYCGVEYEKIQKIIKKYSKEKATKYDAVFIKRLNYGKGVFDLLRIWREVVKSKPDAKLAVIGDGPEDVIDKINNFIESNNLQNNIELLGVIYDIDKKFRIVNSSKIFLLPTHEENWAIVIGESMAAHVPVVVSRLKEIEPIWQDNVVWCGVGKIKQFAEATIKLLDDGDDRQRLEAKAGEFIKRYDWQKIAESEF
jgi:glycosyltransferase involved in cell wall biosynthesis